VQKIVLKKKILDLLQTSVIANNIIALRKDFLMHACGKFMSNLINFIIVGRMVKCILYLFSSPINVEIE